MKVKVLVGILEKDSNVFVRIHDHSAMELHEGGEQAIWNAIRNDDYLANLFVLSHRMSYEAESEYAVWDIEARAD